MEAAWLQNGLLQVKFRSEAYRSSSFGAAPRGSSDLIHHQFMGSCALTSEDSDQPGKHLKSQDTGVSPSRLKYLRHMLPSSRSKALDLMVDH